MKNINIDKINKIYIVIILITIFLNWNYNYCLVLGERVECFFIFSEIGLIFKKNYPFFEKILKSIYYLFTITYIGINIVSLIKEYKKILKFSLKNIGYLCFVIIMLFQIKNLNFSRILFFLNITALLFFTEYLYSVKSNIYTNKKILFLIFTNLSIQFFSLRFMGRNTLGWLDPNFSSYFLFLFYILIDITFKEKYYKILNLIIILAGIFISSRSFFLSIITYIILKNEKVSKILEKLLINLKLNSAIILLILNVLLTIFFAQYYIENIRPKYSYKQDITRLVSFNDGSNLLRFQAIINFKNNLIKNEKLRETGLTVEEYTKSEKIVPHNGTFEIIRGYGLYLGIFAILTIFNSIFFKLNYKNISYFISILLYQTFLGIPFQGAPLLLLAYINALFIKSEEKNYLKIY